MIDYFSSDQWVEPEKGDLIISEPYLPDPNFERTVVLICEHDENGTFGFVLNKRATVSLQEVMEDFSDASSPLYVGGPVQQDTLHFIHRNRTLAKEANEVLTDVFWGGDYAQLASMMNTQELGADEIRFFVGYSGWSEGQLIGELKLKSWIVCKNVDQELIFDTNPDDLWKTVLNRMGGKFKLISNYPTDPRLN